MRRYNLNDCREYAEMCAADAAARFRQSYLVHYCGTDEFGPVWQYSPLGDRPDPGSYVKGCAAYSVQPVSFA